MNRQFDEYDKKLALWLKTTFSNRDELIKANKNLYYGLLRNFRLILDIALPSRTSTYESLKRMLNGLPEGVTFITGQQWLGAKKKYKFICSKYGEFEGVPFKLRQRTWNKGLSGHPEDGKRSNRIKNAKKV